MVLERNDTADTVAKDFRKCNVFSASVQISIHISLVHCIFVHYISSCDT